MSSTKVSHTGSNRPKVFKQLNERIKELSESKHKFVCFHRGRKDEKIESLSLLVTQFESPEFSEESLKEFRQKNKIIDSGFFSKTRKMLDEIQYNLGSQKSSNYHRPELGGLSLYSPLIDESNDQPYENLTSQNIALTSPRSSVQNRASGMPLPRNFPELEVKFKKLLQDFQKYGFDKKDQKFEKDLTQLEDKVIHFNLNEHFTSLCSLEKLIKDENASAENKNLLISIKECKLVVLELIRTRFVELIEDNELNTNSKFKVTIKRYAKIIMYYILWAGGSFLSGAFGFVGMQNIFFLIPGMITPLAWAIPILFVIGDAILFYFFEASMIRKKYGIENVKPDKKIVDLDENEIDLTKQINKLATQFAETNEISVDDYIILNTFNNSIKNKTEIYKVVQEPSKLMKFTKHVVTVIGCSMTCCGIYFGIKSLAAFMIPALLTSPYLWPVVIFFIFVQLGYFFSMRGDGITSLLAPLASKYKEIDYKLKDFNYLKLEDFNHKEYNIKNIAEKIKTQRKMKKNEKYYNDYNLKKPLQKYHSFSD